MDSSSKGCIFFNQIAINEIMQLRNYTRLIYRVRFLAHSMYLFTLPMAYKTKNDNWSVSPSAASKTKKRAPDIAIYFNSCSELEFTTAILHKIYQFLMLTTL